MIIYCDEFIVENNRVFLLVDYLSFSLGTNRKESMDPFLFFFAIAFFYVYDRE